MSRGRKPLARRLLYPVEYAAIRATLAAIQTLPLRTALRMADRVGDLVRRLDARHRGVADANLQAAYPDLSPEEREAVIGQVFRHMARNAAEMAYVPRVIARSTWHRHLELVDLEPAMCRLRRGPGILVTGHMGNWEVLGAALGLLGIRSCGIARRLDNPYLNDYVVGVRQLRGQRIVYKQHAIRRVLQLTREGVCPVFVVDQDAGSQGIFVPFFGRLASVTPAPALLARRLRLPILPGYAVRTGDDFRFEIHAGRPLDPEEFDHLPPRKAVIELTRCFTADLEACVRKAPGQWLWVHRRWKSHPPEETASPAP